MGCGLRYPATQDCAFWTLRFVGGMRLSWLPRSLKVITLLALFPIGIACGFEPAGPPPDKSLEWTFRHASNRTVPIIDLDKSSLEEAVDFLNTPDIPKDYRVEIDSAGFGEKSNRTITLKREGKTVLDLLVEVAEQADANLVFSPGRISLVPRRDRQKAPR
jgi:hypothetical protein